MPSLMRASIHLCLHPCLSIPGCPAGLANVPDLKIQGDAPEGEQQQHCCSSPSQAVSHAAPMLLSIAARCGTVLTVTARRHEEGLDHSPTDVSHLTNLKSASLSFSRHSLWLLLPERVQLGCRRRVRNGQAMCAGFEAAL
eukprot:scaffold40114_cov17-Tisochrysis_lutea.AAC.2